MWKPSAVWTHSLTESIRNGFTDPYTEAAAIHENLHLRSRKKADFCLHHAVDSLLPVRPDESGRGRLLDVRYPRKSKENQFKEIIRIIHCSQGLFRV